MLPILLLLLCATATADLAMPSTGKTNSTGKTGLLTSVPKSCTGNSSDLDPAQCAGYQAFFDGAGGTGWSRGCNNSRLDPCSCGGTCDPNQKPYLCVACDGGNITAITMYNNGMKGAISSAIVKLSTLTRLDLADNQLTGSIPSEIAQLKSLTFLELRNNKLTGIVPPLPFGQYTNVCRFDDPPSTPQPCIEPQCNHFKCPLPPSSDKCMWKSPKPPYTLYAGVHCK